MKIMKKILRLAALMCAVVIFATAMTACGTPKFTASQARKGTVRILSLQNCDLYIEDNGKWVPILNDFLMPFTGSGFGIGEVGKETDIFATNRHVVELVDETLPTYVEDENGDIVVANVRYKGKTAETYIIKDDFSYSETTKSYDTSRLIPCTIIDSGTGSDPDLAIVKAAEKPDGRMALALCADSSKVPEGKRVYALGYPGTSDDYVVDMTAGERYLGAVDSVTVTDGAVSMHTTFNNGSANVRIIQHTAVINHGNSGGPLIDENGAVVGVNTWGWGTDPNTGDIGTNGSVEIEYLKDMLDKNKIEYDLYSSGVPNFVLWIVIAAVALALIAVLIVVIVKSSAKKRPGDGRENSVVTDTLDSGYRVQGISGVHEGRRYAIMTGKPITFGCNGGSVIKFPTGTPGVSGNHCTLWYDNGKVFIKDNGSSYGTFIGQTKIAANQTVQLNPGDSFALGSQKERFTVAVKGGR